MAKTIIGFDISSSTLAWGVLELNEDGYIRLVETDYIKPQKTGSIIDRLANTRNKVKQVLKKHKPDYIGIENIIEFMKQKSSAKTIITLAVFNRMVGLLAYDYLKKSPELFSVMTIRHGLKEGKDLPAKEDMPELVAKHLGISFPYEFKKNGKHKVENEDRADAIAVALYYAFILSGKIVKKKK